MIVAMALVLGGLALVTPAPVGAVDVFLPCTKGATGDVCANKDEKAPEFVGVIVNTLLFIVGIVSVIVIIIGGIMYTVSGGDTAGVTKAKNTILYAVIGLTVAFMAYAIVNWVFGVFTAPIPTAQQQCVDSGGTYNAKTKVCKP